MKIQFNDGTCARIGVHFSDEKPVLKRPVSPKILDGKWRSCEIQVTILNGDKEVGTVIGKSFCSPVDQFQKFEGRKRAAKRALCEIHRADLLSTTNIKAIGPYLFYGYLRKSRRDMKRLNKAQMQIDEAVAK